MVDTELEVKSKEKVGRMGCRFGDVGMVVMRVMLYRCFEIWGLCQIRMEKIDAQRGVMNGKKFLSVLRVLVNRKMSV